MPMFSLKSTFPILFFIFLHPTLDSQNDEPQNSNWDNVMYIANKVSWGKSETIRQSAEFQTRYRDDFSELEQWHVEYAGTRLLSKNWEIVPDFRFTRKPSRYEYRPGLGIIYKNLFKKAQLVHQVKYQYDIKNSINNSHGLRYAVFYNHAYSKKILFTALAGALFEFGETFSGFQGLRTGLAGAYIFDESHSINMGYFYGLANDPTNNYSKTL